MKAQLRFEVFNIFNHVNFLSNQMNINFNPSSVTYNTNDPATATTITGFHGAEQLRTVHRDTRCAAGPVRHQADLLEFVGRTPRAASVMLAARSVFYGVSAARRFSAS